MCVTNVLCAFGWNEKKKLTARMDGVESFKMLVVLSRRTIQWVFIF